MPAIQIPSLLQKLTSHKEIVISGQDVNEVLEALSESYPGIKPYIFDHSGGLTGFINIYLNGQDIRYQQGLKTSVSEQDILTIVPAMAGG